VVCSSLWHGQCSWAADLPYRQGAMRWALFVRKAVIADVNRLSEVQLRWMNKIPGGLFAKVRASEPVALL
jgi:hypothetical protein